MLYFWGKRTFLGTILGTFKSARTFWAQKLKTLEISWH